MATTSEDVQFVFLTEKGESFHAVIDCEALRKGQAKAIDEGKRLTPTRRARLEDALRQGRRRCRTCFVR
jgi:hypothetical protein